jgi:hypothetical protein
VTSVLTFWGCMRRRDFITHFPLIHSASSGLVRPINRKKFDPRVFDLSIRSPKNSPNVGRKNLPLNVDALPYPRCNRRVTSCVIDQKSFDINWFKSGDTFERLIKKRIQMTSPSNHSPITINRSSLAA